MTNLIFPTSAYLHFEHGPTFSGHINWDETDPRLPQEIWGEAAFTTGLCGYQETVSDPSFLGQHIIFCYPHIGNYPAHPRFMQSKKVQGTSLIASAFSPNIFFQELDIPLFQLSDTRSLVKFLVKGSVSPMSAIALSKERPSPSAFAYQREHALCNQLARVSTEDPQVLVPGTVGEKPIVVLDYGIKKAILDQLIKLGFPLVLLGHKTTWQQVKSYNPRMVFLSNGPGDPSLYQEQREVVREIIQSGLPVRAICLGHQLLGLALGAKSYRLPYGHRGQNHPVLEKETGRVLITSQNHGYALDQKSLLEVSQNNFLNLQLKITHTSLFDQSVEGLASVDNRLRTVQFHPEAAPGPLDALPFFDEIKNYLSSSTNVTLLKQEEKQEGNQEEKTIPYKKILVIGPGPIRIGQASEFDYSGTQACKVLRESGVEVVLHNSNPATIMTDPEVAHRTYIEPMTAQVVKKIVEREKVDAVLSTLGGQTALNLCLELALEGYWQEQNVALLGSSPDTIRKAEDRDLFSLEVEALGYKTGKRVRAMNREEVCHEAEHGVGLPLIIRRNFALGGQGALIVHNLSELDEAVEQEIHFPLTLEKSLKGYKEIELEIMVDCEQNAVVVCSIENIDPCGVHTGDSITVAPAQTISDECYQNLRTMALAIGRRLGLVAGGANVQFAINPHDENDIVVIEMNPRVSRSSALASKATGYPIAKISTLLALGFTLKDILNDITKASPVCFEPTLDYVAVKIPLFPFNKFPLSKRTLGPQMRSVGEVLAIGANFSEAFMKALRSLELGLEIPSLNALKGKKVELNQMMIEKRLQDWQELSLLTVLEAIRLGMKSSTIYELSKISPWFIERMEDWHQLEKNLLTITNHASVILDDKEKLLSLKAQGFSDKYLAKLLHISEEDVYQSRVKHQLFPSYSAVDTCSGEFPARTPYFYSSYGRMNEAMPFSHEGDQKQSILIVGSGPNRIGQGIEFDYSCVKAAQVMSKTEYYSVMVNSNPETVSTDYDSSDRLYLSPLYVEDVLDIIHWEKPHGILTSFSGQTGIHLRKEIETTYRHQYFNSTFLGPKWKSIEMAEDRLIFGELLAKVPVQRTKYKLVKGFPQVLQASEEIGYPVIIRPSFVIGGESMFIFNSPEDIGDLPPSLLTLLNHTDSEFLVENYLEDAYEYDVDLVRDGQGQTIFTLCEHIEHAGVHSGDSGMITPPLFLSETLYMMIKKISLLLAQEMEIIGPINFQFAVKDKKIYCIEANPRGSRTLPFLSKAYGISLAQEATMAMLGHSLTPHFQEKLPVFCVKQSTFPFERFLEDNILLGPKMRSTGETMGIDLDRDQAIFKSYLASYPRLEGTGKILISLDDHHKAILSPYLKGLHKIGHQFYATNGTCEFIIRHGIPCKKVARIGEEGKSITEAIQKDDIVMVFNTPSNLLSSQVDNATIRLLAIQRGIACFTRPENIKAIIESLIGRQSQLFQPLCLQELSQWRN